MPNARHWACHCPGRWWRAGDSPVVQIAACAAGVRTGDIRLVSRIIAGRIIGELAARILDTLPGADVLVAWSKSCAGCRCQVITAGAIVVPVKFPGIAALRAGHHVGQTPGGIAATIAIDDGITG